MILGGKKIKVTVPQGDKSEVDGAATDERAANAVNDRDADFSKLDEAPNGAAAEGEPASEEGSEDSLAEITALKAEVAEHKDKYLRALADFENYKKRALKDRSDLIKYQGERVIGDFLEVLDTLELALSHAESDPAKVQEGIKLIHKMFVDTLGRWEVRADSAMGADFDPVKHKAISRMVVPNTKAGTIIGELKKPYFYKDKLLRPGEVVVAAPPAEENPASPENANEEG